MAAKKKTAIKEVHQVTASLRNWELAKRESAVEFRIKKGAKMLGTLAVGRGSVAWTPANKQTAIMIPWPKFASMIEAE